MDIDNTANIRYYFPVKNTPFLAKDEFAASIMDMLRADKGIDLVGYKTDEDLYSNFLYQLENSDFKKYTPPSTAWKTQLSWDIQNTVISCSKLLPLPQAPVTIFVFPWFPEKEKGVTFGGVSGEVPYQQTMHLYIDLSSYTKESLLETVAHEWNHVYFYAKHPKNEYTLLEKIAMEGLAECFRITLLGGNAAPWSIALEKDKALEIWGQLQSKLHSKNHELYLDVFFGGKGYLRWTGYSIGYWLTKDFCNAHQEMSWEEIMKLEPGTNLFLPFNRNV